MYPAVLYQPTGQSLLRCVQPLVSPRSVTNDCSTVRTQFTLNPWMPSRCISGARLAPRVATRHVYSLFSSVPLPTHLVCERNDALISYARTGLSLSACREHARARTGVVRRALVYARGRSSCSLSLAIFCSFPFVLVVVSAPFPPPSCRVPLTISTDSYGR
jgi:hypothetical protein